MNDFSKLYQFYQNKKDMSFSVIAIDYNQCVRKTFENYSSMKSWLCEDRGNNNVDCFTFYMEDDEPFRTSYIYYADNGWGRGRTNLNAIKIFRTIANDMIIPSTGRMVLAEACLNDQDVVRLCNILPEHNLKWFSNIAKTLN